MNETKYEYYYVTIDGRIGGLRSCYSAQKYENYSKAFEMYKTLVEGYILINNTNVTLSIVGSNEDNTDMMVISYIKINND